MRFRFARVCCVAALFIGVTAESCGESTGPKSYFLALSTLGSGSGTISASPAPGDEDGLPEGTTVTITATPAAGSDFTGWGELDVAGCTEPKNPCTLVMNDRKSVVAHFVPSSSEARFNGLYSASFAAGSGIDGHTLELTITNGAVQGKTSPLFGSLRDFTGTLSSTGAFTAAIEPGASSACRTNLSGTITTALVDGITTATLQGDWHVTSTGGVGCGVKPLPSGTWSATRDRIKVAKMSQ